VDHARRAGKARRAGQARRAGNAARGPDNSARGLPSAAHRGPNDPDRHDIVHGDRRSFSAVAGVVVTALGPRVVIPVVVAELLFGILIGPQVAGIAKFNSFTSSFGDLGLGMLFFFAGYEIDFARVRGRALELAGLGWALSLVLAYGIGEMLATAGIVLSLVYTGTALATTAIGTLIPILGDSGELRTRFGTCLLAAGAVGEFGPILLVTLFLSTSHPLSHAAILIALALLALITGVVAVRSMGRGWEALERTLESSGQVAVRLLVVLVFGLVTLASHLVWTCCWAASSPG
jgi:Kef-type K+ transport system membrane component KefB